ncbi:MAG: hypothetical protein KC550_01180 [Nanoarchaeota archaeon]|nr:hypothetical protein [Nanoarchaeota archaeon]
MGIIELLEDTRPKFEDIDLGFKIHTNGRFKSSFNYHSHVIGLYGEKFVDTWLHSKKFAALPKFKRFKGINDLDFSVKKSNFGLLIVDKLDGTHISEVDNYVCFDNTSFLVEVKTGYMIENIFAKKLEKDTKIHESLFPNLERNFLIFSEPNPNLDFSVFNYPILNLDLSGNYFDIMNYLIESGQMKESLYDLNNDENIPKNNPFSELKLAFENK